MSKKMIEIHIDRDNVYHKFCKELGLYLFILRSQKNLSLRQLGLEIEMKEERIDRLETGRAKFDHSGAMKLLKRYKLRPYLMLYGEGDKPKE